MTILPLRRVASINPSCPKFENTPSDSVVTFMPLEAVWPSGRADVSRRAIKADVAIGYSRFDAGDILVPKVTPTFEAGRACRPALATQAGSASTEVHVVRGEGVDSDFLTYVFQSRRFLTEGATTVEGVGNLRRVPVEWLANYPVWLPCPDAQRAVVDFLDRETAKIDALIAKQETLTRSVLEHRDAVILDLITGGKGAAKSEASGVDWIGDMPEHWQTRPLRHVLASVETGVWGSDPAVEWEGTPCARVADFDRERLQVTDPIPTLREVSVEDVRRRGLRRGDLLIERSGGTQANPVGFVVSFESDTEAVCSNFISRLRLQDGMNHRYWLYAFYAARLTRITEKWTKQTTGIQNLDFGGFSSEHFPCPPSSEQDEIAAEIDQLMSSTGAQLQRQRLLGQLLGERRAALITAAVTGRLDVTTYGKAG